MRKIRDRIIFGTSPRGGTGGGGGGGGPEAGACRRTSTNHGVEFVGVLGEGGGRRERVSTNARGGRWEVGGASGVLFFMIRVRYKKGVVAGSTEQLLKREKLRHLFANIRHAKRTPTALRKRRTLHNTTNHKHRHHARTAATRKTIPQQAQHATQPIIKHAPHPRYTCPKNTHLFLLRALDERHLLLQSRARRARS